MEIKKFSDMVMENKDTMVDVTPIFENFPLSRIVLQQNLKNINILNAINQLLSRYHPDDGIAAYEHVLKTLLVLSENFDNSTQQQIISIVPLPNGASYEAIRDILYKTTDLIRTAHNVKIAVVPEEKLDTEVLNKESMIHLSQNGLADTASKNLDLDESFIPSVSEVFRGFPPNEISMIHNHVKNVNYVYDTLDYTIPYIEPCTDVRQNFSLNTGQQEESLKLQSNLKFKWIHTPHPLYKNNTYQVSSSSCEQEFFKSINEKYFQLPIDKVNNCNQWNVVNMSHTLYQNSTYFKKKLCKNEAISNKHNTTEIVNSGIANSDTTLSHYRESLYNEDLNSEKYDNILNENKIFNTEKRKRFDQELKAEQQAIQEDIYKMDVVCWSEEINTLINNQISREDNFTMDDFIIHRKLKTSVKNFLKRSEQEIFIEFPKLPSTKSLDAVSSTSKYWKFLTQKNLENKNQLDLLTNNENNSKEKKTKLIEKKASGSLNVYSKLSQQVFQKSLNIALNKTQTVESEKKDNIENLLYKSAAKQTEQSNMNLLQQTASVTELTTFKKHYDTLLNIQKAKVAVANSLALSSVEKSTKYDPHYSNCSYQQQQLLQQHRLSMNPQFAMHTVAQSGLSNVRNSPYTWVRCNSWKHPTVRQFRFSQQSPLQHSRNKENSVLHYVKTMDIQCFAQDKSKQMKQYVQRKKLEDIVGKLKEIESSNINN